MTFLSPDELAALEVERMIFHVVGHDEKPEFLREAPVSSLGDFFKERIASGNTGIRLVFKERSSTEAALRRALEHRERFNRESRYLAKRFHEKHRRTMSEGLFMLFQLKCVNEKLFAILKYDQQEVVRVAIQSDSQGRKRVKLRALESALVKTPEALQKSAIIRWDQNGGRLCVRDRSVNSSITRYFQDFLVARRERTVVEQTKTLRQLTQDVAKATASSLAPATKRNVMQKIDDVLRAGGSFNADEPAAFISAVFGQQGEESVVAKAFEKAIKTYRMEGESFDIDAQSIPEARRKQLVTVEGITVTYHRELQPRVIVTDAAAGGKTITITTAGVEREDDVPE